MTAEERAALIDRLAPLIIEERRKAAEQNPKRPPWYMMNIAHPGGWAGNNKPKPRPLNQGGGFRKTGHSLPII